MNSMTIRPANQQIGAALQSEVLRHGRSGASLAPILGLSKSAIYRRFRGETPVKLNEVVAIAPELGMEAPELLIALKPGRQARTDAHA